MKRDNSWWKSQYIKKTCRGVMSAAWQFERFSWCLLLKFQQIRQLYSTKDFLFNTQTCLRFYALKHRKAGKSEWVGKEEREKNREGCFRYRLEFSRGGIRLQHIHSAARRNKEVDRISISAWVYEHIQQLSPVTGIISISAWVYEHIQQLSPVTETEMECRGVVAMV